MCVRLGEKSEVTRKRTEQARERQRKRFGGMALEGRWPLQVNADIGPAEVRQFRQLDDASRMCVRAAMPT